MNIQSAMPSKEKIIGLATITIAVCALAACSGGSSPSSKSTEPADTTGVSADSASANTGDPAATNKQFHNSAVANGSISARKPCDLLTQADSETTVGQPLPKKKENITLGMCDYSAEDYSAGASLSVGSWKSVKNTATAGSSQPVAISGVGDEALALNSNGSMLYVRKGDEGFFVKVFGPKINGLPDKGLAHEEELALKVLNKF